MGALDPVHYQWPFRVPWTTDAPAAPPIPPEPETCRRCRAVLTAEEIHYYGETCNTCEGEISEEMTRNG